METNIKTADVLAYQEAPELNNLKAEILGLVSLLSEEDCKEILGEIFK